MSILRQKNKSASFLSLGSQADFAKKERVLTHQLTAPENHAREVILLELGWLYDQRALISPPWRKKTYQKKARYYFNRAMRNGAKRWIVYNGLGTVSLHEGKYKEALWYYKKMHAIHNSSISHNAMGNAYRQLKKFAVAKKRYETSVILSKNVEEKSAAIYNLIQLSRDRKEGGRQIVSNRYYKMMKKFSTQSLLARVLFNRIKKASAHGTA